MAAGGPAAGGRRQASFLGRAQAGPSLERNPSNPFQKPLEVQQKLALVLSEEAQCSLGANLNGASRLLLNCPSGRQVSSSHQLVGLAVYQYAKFEALNRRINKTRSSENMSGQLPRVQYPRFSKLPINWLSDLFPMFPRASRIITDNILHLSQAQYAS